MAEERGVGAGKTTMSAPQRGMASRSGTSIGRQVGLRPLPSWYGSDGAP